MATIDEIRLDPDSFLDDENKMKEIVSDSVLIIALLEAKDETSVVVSIDGQDVALVCPVNPNLLE